MSKSALHLTIVSQEKKLLDLDVDSITVTTSEGELTILPEHISLFTQLVPGELVYRHQKQTTSYVVSRGFLDVGSENQVTVIVDSAIAARDVSEEKAQLAIKQAHETMQSTQNQRELLLAEASLKQAMLELKIAQRTKKAGI